MQHFRQLYFQNDCSYIYQMIKVLVTAATPFEWHLASQLLPTYVATNNPTLQVQFCTTGVGMLATTYSLMHLLHLHKPQIVIQIGIAGAFSREIPLGTVTAVQSDIVGDMGVWEQEQWRTIFSLNLAQPNEPPFTNGQLVNTWLHPLNVLSLPVVDSVSVNQITTQLPQIQAFRQQLNVQLESMEGAALHYVCLQQQVPFIQMRSISNYVGERNKSNWRLQQSIENVNLSLVKWIQYMQQYPPNLL